MPTFKMLKEYIKALRTTRLVPERAFTSPANHCLKTPLRSILTIVSWWLMDEV